MRRDAVFMALELNAVRLVGRGRAARLRKPDSGHTGSITIPDAPGQLERHETPDPVRSDAVNSRFQDVRLATGGRPAGVGQASGRHRPETAVSGRGITEAHPAAHTL